MPTGGKTTLTQFIIESRRRFPGATGDLNGLITDVALACKAISRKVAFGRLPLALAGVRVNGGSANDAAEESVDAISNRIFMRANEWGGHVAGMACAAMAEPSTLPGQHPRGKYLLLFEGLDASSNIDVNVPVGSIFSILRAKSPGVDPAATDFLQAGTEQVCAGYAIYGPSTMLVLTLGDGTHAFTLEPMLGEWVISHPRLRVPEDSCEFAVNASNSRFWESAIKRYVDECIAGRSGARGTDFTMRWIASLVADVHRILMRGGVFIAPRASKEQAAAGRLRLLYEANPMAMLIEQAGGAASTGRGRVMEVAPIELNQHVPVILGSAREIERVVRYHHEADTGQDQPYVSPLFSERSLFRSEVRA